MSLTSYNNRERFYVHIIGDVFIYKIRFKPSSSRHLWDFMKNNTKFLEGEKRYGIDIIFEEMDWLMTSIAGDVILFYLWNKF